MTTKSSTILIDDLMQNSGVGFGTSGARGKIQDMTDLVCYVYTSGFLQYLRQSAELAPSGFVGIAGDLRSSSPRIMQACAQAVRDLGHHPIHCGYIPTPALANWGLSQGIPTIMITGSHIPDDRNGIKFNKATGEILKDDEAKIRLQKVELPAGLFADDGTWIKKVGYELPAVSKDAAATYCKRYLEFFPTNCLAGLHVGLYEHSSVAREILNYILTQMGALVTPLGRSEQFIPVDTEAMRPEDQELAYGWMSSGQYHCIVSTDGDGDRPLITDEHGEWLRGDIAGLLAAKYLQAKVVVTPVSSNTAVEASGWFAEVLRTRIGSPFVIEGMKQALAKGLVPVVGYEANGGFLLGSAVARDQHSLTALPTRDAIIVILAVLLLSTQHHCPISQLVKTVPQRFTASDRLKHFPIELSHSRIEVLLTDSVLRETMFASHCGVVTKLDTTDGLRLIFANKEVVHLRPSGNAPELRVYTEADSPARALTLLRVCLDLLEGWRVT